MWVVPSRERRGDGGACRYERGGRQRQYKTKSERRGRELLFGAERRDRVDADGAKGGDQAADRGH